MWRIFAGADGIPLAIELAASRLHVLSVQQIGDRLDDAFKLLTEGSRTGLSHHQTLRMAMDWSYDLLSAEESLLFRKLSVFAGGFSLDAVEAICAAEDDDSPGTLDLLQHLVEKSMVVAEDYGTVARYRLLETMRQYAYEKLDKDKELPAMRRGHMDYFLAFAEDAEPNIQGSGRDLAQAEWLDRLEEDHDNLRIALKYSEKEGDGGFAVALAGAPRLLVTGAGRA